MKLTAKISTKGGASGAFTLVEALVYIGVLVVITAVGFSALYRCMDSSRALSRNTNDIADALHAGEAWRADVRAARGPILVRTNNAERIIRIPTPRGDVSYRFADGTMFRRMGENDWSPWLSHVNSSEFISESRGNLTVWRWELELQSRSQKIGLMKPVFTFLAVPEEQFL